MYYNRLLNLIATFYNRLIAITSSFQSLFLLWMRLTWGHQFFLTGSKILATSPSFIGYTQLICGILLIVGLASRLASLPLLCITLTALATVHASTFSDYQVILDPSIFVHLPPYPYFITTLLVLIFGPGRISLDGWIKRWVSKQPQY